MKFDPPQMGPILEEPLNKARLLTPAKPSKTWHCPIEKLWLPEYLMVQKSGDHQLSLAAYPIIYKVYTSQVVQDSFHH